ncbi:MAG: hypothetical protein AB7F79_11765 [Steroidobacteraceae bacterium]
MQADFRKFKRRPFFLPLLMPVALLAVVVAAAIWLLDARVSTVVVLVRNAEVEQSLVANPGLNELGKARANALLQLLERAKPGRAVDAVYAIESVPAQQTAAPLAAKMGIAVNVLATGGSTSQLSHIRDNHAGEVVLVVASRDKLLALLHEVGDQDWLIDELDYGSIFVVTQSRLSKPAVIRLKY